MCLRRLNVNWMSRFGAKRPSDSREEIRNTNKSDIARLTENPFWWKAIQKWGKKSMQKGKNVKGSKTLSIR